MSDDLFQNFLDTNMSGPPIQGPAVPEATFEKYAGVLPDSLLRIWRNYGWAGCADGRFWLTDPDEWRSCFDEWLEPVELPVHDNYHVVARNAFGNLECWGERTGPSLALDVVFGELHLNDQSRNLQLHGRDALFRAWLLALEPGILDISRPDGTGVFATARAALGQLTYGEVYAFLPAVTISGGVENSQLHRVSAVIQVGILAQYAPYELALYRHDHTGTTTGSLHRPNRVRDDLIAYVESIPEELRSTRLVDLPPELQLPGLVPPDFVLAESGPDGAAPPKGRLPEPVALQEVQGSDPDDVMFQSFLQNGFGPPLPGQRVPQEAFDRYAGVLPDALLGYWKGLGWAGFADGRFWFTDPAEWSLCLQAWLELFEPPVEDSYLVIARDAFGRLHCWGERTGPSLWIDVLDGWAYPQDYRALTEQLLTATSQTAAAPETARRAVDDLVLKTWLMAQSPAWMDVIEGDGTSVFADAQATLGGLGYDEVYEFSPPRTAGGSVQSRVVRKSPARTTATLLAQFVPRVTVYQAPPSDEPVADGSGRGR